jgi:hypothetical protein
MIEMPAHVTTRWIATLENDQLVAAEKQLYSAFRTRETAEKSRAGSRYALLQGPPELVTAWERWTLVNNEVRARGVMIRR